MKGPCGYGRYDDGPSYVGCPRAQSDMTPCIARDGRLALANDGMCVGCGASPWPLLAELDGFTTPAECADVLRDVVRAITDPSRQQPQED